MTRRASTLRIRVRFYFRAARLLDAMTKGVQLLLNSIFLGWFDRDDLAVATTDQYARWPKYTTREYNLSGLNSWEVEALEQHFAGCRTLLLAGAGGGRELVALARRGLDVVAFDCSPLLVEHAAALARDLGLSPTVLLSEPDRVPVSLPDGDGAIVGWGAYMHIPGSSNRIRFLRDLRDHLPTGAPILLSFFTRTDDSPSFRWAWRVARLARWIRQSSELVELGDSLSGTFDHHFTEAELRRELAEAGFEMRQFAAQPYAHAVGTATRQAVPSGAALTTPEC